MGCGFPRICEEVGAPFTLLLQDSKRRRVCRACEPASVAICSATSGYQVAPFAPRLRDGKCCRVLRACEPASVTVCPASVSYPNARPVCPCQRKTFLRALTKRGISKINMGKEWRFFVEKVKKRSARDSPANRFWRRHPDLNRGVRVLQTLALPLGYGADFPFFGK